MKLFCIYSSTAIAAASSHWDSSLARKCWGSAISWKNGHVYSDIPARRVNSQWDKDGRRCTVWMHEMCIPFRGKEMGEVSTPRLQLKDHILSMPTEVPASISWINAVPWSLSCSRTHRAKDTDWRKGQRLCHCAVNTNYHPGWQKPLDSEPAVCTPSAVHMQLAHSLSLKKRHLYLSMTETSSHPQSMKKSWAALLTAASLPPSCMQTCWPNIQAPDWAQSQLYLATRKWSQTSSVSATVQQWQKAKLTQAHPNNRIIAPRNSEPVIIRLLMTWLVFCVL